MLRKDTSEPGGLLWRLIPARMCELLVGLGEVDLVGVNEWGEGAPLGVVICSRKACLNRTGFPGERFT